MKLKYLFFIIMCLGMTVTSEAQIFKKLKKKAEKAIERTILKKTDSIVTKKTEKAIDSIAKDDPKKSRKNKKTEDASSNEKKAKGIFGSILGKAPTDTETETSTGGTDLSVLGDPIPAPPDNNVKLPDSYKFSYQATLQLKTNNGNFEAEYYLQPKETYYAKKQTQNGITEYIVYDSQRNVEVHFTNIKGEPKQFRQKMDLFTKARLIGAYRDAPNRTAKYIGKKNLLGFNCEGYEIITDAGTTQLWITNEAPATIYGAMFKNRLPKYNLPFTENAMVMKVDFTAVDNPDKNYQIVCVELKQNDMILNNKEQKL